MATTMFAIIYGGVALVWALFLITLLTRSLHKPNKVKVKTLYPKVKKQKKTKPKRLKTWTIQYHLLYDGGYSDFEIEYSNLVFGRVAAFYRVKVSSWGGEAVLIDNRL